MLAEPDETVVGTLDEDFAVESLAGDVFLLGTTSWRIRRVEAGPRARGGCARRGADDSVLARRSAGPHCGAVERGVAARANDDPAKSERRHGRSTSSSTSADSTGAARSRPSLYVRAGAAALGALPIGTTVVAERFFDEGGGMQLVLHAPFGARINQAWGLALRKRFCRSFNFELQAAATDNGIVISLSDQHSFPLELVFKFLSKETVEEVLTQAMLPAPMFEVRWRWDTSRALAVLRFAGGRKVPPPIQRMRADDLLAAVFPDQAACQENIVGDIRIPDHPLVNETIKDCLHEAMDLDGLKRLVEQIGTGELKTVAIDTPEPSPFSHEILNANPYAYLDDAPLEERRARAVQMRRTIGPDAAGVGALDPAAIAEVAAESWPAARDAEELHDALLTLVVVPPVREWEEFFRTLRESRRATVLSAGGANFWVAAERSEVRALAVSRRSDRAGDRRLRPDADIRSGIGGDRDAARMAGIDRPADAERPRAAIRAARRGHGGRVAAARSRGADPARPVHRFGGRSHGSEIEWCNRRVLARIHRLTLGRLRREIEPVNARDFMRFLYHWQHLKPGTQLHGPDGALHIIKQLQGYEISAAAWEGDVLRRRVGKYAPELLDQLCISGEVVWGRLSPHPAFDDQERAQDRRRQACAADAVGAGRAVSARGRAVAARSGGEPRVGERPGARSAAGFVGRGAPGARIARPSRRVVSCRCRQGHAPADERRRRRLCGSSPPPDS